jgi:hypothetical protein
MHILYLDDSGSVQNPADNHIILAGFSLFERQCHWLSDSLNNLAEKTWPEGGAGLEFRAADMWSGKRHWRGLEKSYRQEVMGEALDLIGNAPSVPIFAAAIHRRASGEEDPLMLAFEHLANRFDRMLGRLHKGGDTQRGLIVLDKSTYETSLQALSITFRSEGHRWGKLVNLAEAPLFIDSRATRLIQAADLVAYSLRRYYVHGDAAYFDRIRSKFDAQGGVVHGLVHQVPAGEACPCHVCRVRP